MKFLSKRDLPDRSARLRELLGAEDLVLASGGKPIAVVIGVGEGELEETLDLLRQLRAHRAISRLRRTPLEGGTNRLSPAEIDLEIRQARSGRRSS